MTWRDSCHNNTFLLRAEPTRPRALKWSEAAWERHEQAEAKARVARYEACAKTLVPAGEPILALDSDSEIEPGVRLLGVTNLVSDLFYCIFVKLIQLVGSPGGEAPVCCLHQAG